jgi:hypothetical protein
MSQFDQVSCDLSHAIDIVVINRVPEILHSLVIDYYDGHTISKKLPTQLLAK